MKQKTHSFQSLLIIFSLFLIIMGCNEKKKVTIEKDQFIEIYSRLLIIHELEISKEYQDRLLGELFSEFQVTSSAIDSTIAEMNRQPDEWLDVLEQVRARIQEYKKNVEIKLGEYQKEPQPAGLLQKKKPGFNSKKKEIQKETRNPKTRDSNKR